MQPGGFRTAYTTQGVSRYYTANWHTYRNPHFPGVVKCIHAILNNLILTPRATAPARYNPNDVVIEKDTGERVEISFQEDDREEEAGLTVFDCAAGGGEATVAVREWVGRVMPEILGDGGEGEMGEVKRRAAEKKRRRKRGLRVYASDPFTSELYEERVNGFRKSEGVQNGARGGSLDVENEGTESGDDGEETETTVGQGEEPAGITQSSPSAQAQLEPLQTENLPISDSTLSTSTPAPLTTIPPTPPHPYVACHSFSFRDIPIQGLDTLLSTPPGYLVSPDDPLPLYIDLTFISFALHLCPPSELFSLLYELSRHSAYLIVIAPHKNPHIPGGGESGWVGPIMEVLVKKERVRGRVFRSVSF